jgi:hypothetical protein
MFVDINRNVKIYVILSVWGFRYLSLVAGLTSEADYVFIPEWPPERGWPAKLCRKLQQARTLDTTSVYQTMCLLMYVKSSVCEEW